MTLVGYYPLDEDSGTTAYDYSGNENHGTANGAGPSGTGTVAGPLNASAYDFDGTDDKVQTPLSPHDVGIENGGVTFTFFVNRSNTGDNEGYFSNRIDNSKLLSLGTFPDNIRLQTRRGGTDQKVETGTLSWTTSTWYLITFTWDGSTVRIFRDGIELASGTMTNTLVDAVFRIGVGGFNTYTDSLIADVRIYDRALSPQEIAYLYQVGQEAHIRTEVKSV